MPTVTASLDVTFTNLFIGQHRVCWAIYPSTIYDCSTVIYCATAGTQTVNIPITVDNETCNSVDYIGYVQASCQEISSETGRIPFSATFVPTPACSALKITCERVGIYNISFTNGGRGYGPNNPPSILISGGHATASVVVGNNINITNAGTLYTDGTYYNVPYVNIVGVGSGGQATVVISGGVITSVITTLDGISYLNNNTFTFNVSDIGSTGSGFIGQFSLGYSTIVYVSLLTNFPLNTSIPTVTIDPPLGEGVLAEATAVLGPCVNQILGVSCDNVTTNTITNMHLGQSMVACMLTAPILNSAYSSTTEGCCYDCKYVSFNNTSETDPVTVYFVDCTEHNILQVIVGPGTTEPVCAVNNSWYWDETIPVAVTVGAVCP